MESYRVEGMEIYSTTLWHLQKDVALSALSKDLTDMDKNCPEVTLVSLSPSKGFRRTARVLICSLVSFAGLVRRRKLFQPAEGARHCH